MLGSHPGGALSRGKTPNFRNVWEIFIADEEKRGF